MITVVLIEPEGEVNVGSIARAMSNFAVENLILVNPKCKIGFETQKFAKHAWFIVEKARRVKTFEEAVKGFDIVVGTSGVPARFSDQLKNTVNPSQLAEMIKADEKVALVFGGESLGLSENNLLECDIVATIPTSKEYAVLNLSHSVAVLLYELFKAGKCGQAPQRLERKKHLKIAARAHRENVEHAFDNLARSMALVNNPKKVSQAFKNIVERARPTEDELQAILAAIGPLNKAAKKLPKK